jgi:hypothetical protein
MPHALYNQVEAGFGCDIDPLIGQFGNDLFGRHISKCTSVGNIKDFLFFTFRKLIGRCRARALALIATAHLQPPSHDRSGTEANYGRSLVSSEA